MAVFFGRRLSALPGVFAWGKFSLALPRGLRAIDPADILVPAGYRVQVFATGLNAPAMAAFDERGDLLVAESGHQINAQPRVLKIDRRTGGRTVVVELPWVKTGALTGLAWHQSRLYLSHTGHGGKISVLHPDGRLEDLVTDLPSFGDHQHGPPVVGPDDKLYWGQGSVTNLGVVGPDNWRRGWLRVFPAERDVPAQDIYLRGVNFEALDPAQAKRRVRTGAFVPFGTPTDPGQRIPGGPKCTGAVLRCNLDGTDLEVCAWGLRHPTGLAFTQEGRLFAVERGSDQRGAQYLANDPDDFYEIEESAWYGWPDFASGILVNDGRYKLPGRPSPQLLLAEHPDPDPPKPFACLPPHAGASGFAFSPGGPFGFEGDAFIALFGDPDPGSDRAVPRRGRDAVADAAGFKVVRVDRQTGRVLDFAYSRVQGPASKCAHAGFERPVHCVFGPDGALYVVDWGEVKAAGPGAGLETRPGTGVIWRIHRAGGSQGDVPPAQQPPARSLVPPARLLVSALGLAGLGWLIRRLRQRRRET